MSHEPVPNRSSWTGAKPGQSIWAKPGRSLWADVKNRLSRRTRDSPFRSRRTHDSTAATPGDDGSQQQWLPTPAKPNKSRQRWVVGGGGWRRNPAVPAKPNDSRQRRVSAKPDGDEVRRRPFEQERQPIESERQPVWRLHGEAGGPRRA
jgi:hypothetical protein